MGLVSKDDGEFWMQYEDCLKFFYQVETCHLVLPSEVNKPESQAYMKIYHGSWSKKFGSAGGIRE